MKNSPFTSAPSPSASVKWVRVKVTAKSPSVLAFELLSTEENELLHNAALNSSCLLPELLRVKASHRMQVERPGIS